MTEIVAVHTELFKHFSDNESFRNWLSGTIFDVTYRSSTPYDSPSKTGDR